MKYAKFFFGFIIGVVATVSVGWSAIVLVTRWLAN